MIPLFTELQQDKVIQTQFLVSNLFVVYCFVMSLITDNVSQVDRLWPVMPAVHSWVFVYLEYVRQDNTSPQTFQRLLACAILVTLWCCRLVFNYWRKDGYKSGTEDYRWEHVKKFFDYPRKKFLFTLFNFFFIAIYQCWLLLSLTLPLWYIQRYNRSEPLNYTDAVLVGLFLAFLLFETVADQQQWNYQIAKYNWINTKVNSSNGFYSDMDFKRGFLTKGLFRYSRHPNFFAEMTLWWILYAFTLSSAFTAIVSGQKDNYLWNSSVYGTILLSLLFQGSTILTENITKSKYKEYGVYQSSVSRFFPWFSRYEAKKPY